MFRSSCSPRRGIQILIVICVANITVLSSPTWASDLSERLWGGRGSSTTATQLYVPPPLTTETAVVPVTDATVMPSAQTQLMIGSPGATTLPPGGVIASNGIATNMTSTGTVMPGGITNAGYVWPSQPSTASGIVQATQWSSAQPVVQPTVEYEWSYSTIKDVTYEPVSVYDPRLGGYVTTYQEKQTESVLPWLHRKQVVRYKPAATDTMSASTVATIGPFSGGTTSSLMPSSPASSTSPSERSIVNRLFPVSTVPTPPVQAVPVQTLPVQAAPMATYASGTAANTTVMPVVSTVTSTTTANQQTPISSRQADIPPTLSGSVISPSIQQVLYPMTSTDAPANNGNTLYSTPVPPATTTLTPGSAVSPPTTGSSGSLRSFSLSPTSTQSGTPTLAPPRSEAEQPVDTTRENDIEQPTRIEDSLSHTMTSEKPHIVEMPDGVSLPAPATASPSTMPTSPSSDTPTQTDSTTGSQPAATDTSTDTTPDSATTGDTTPLTLQSATRQTLRPQRTTVGRPGMSVSPTRMSPLFE